MEKINENKMSLFKMTWPLFIELFLQMLSGSADQIMLSNYSTTAVGAVGNANQIINLLLLTFTVISLATTILVSLYLGANDNKKVSQIYSLAVLVNVILSVVISILVIATKDFTFTLMNVPQELMKEAGNYLTIVCMFLPVQAIFLTFSAIFKANAFMKKAMSAAIVVNLLNIVGNYFLINGFGALPAMGASGAAISTSFSRVVGMIFVIIMFRKSIKNATISFKHLRPFPIELLKKLLYIGLPAGGENLSYNLSQLAILSFINTMGNDMITLKIYASTLAWFAYVFAMATSQSSQIMVGYLIGAGKFDEANERTLKTFKCSAPVSIGITLIILLLSDYIFTALNCPEYVLPIARTLFFIELGLEIGRAYNMIFIRALQAAGDVVFPVVVGIVSMWVISVVIGYVLGVKLNLGLIGLWIAMAADELIRAVIFIIRWKSNKWRKMSAI